MSDDIEVDGDAGRGSSWIEETGVWRSNAVRRRFEGGISGECPWLSNFMSSANSSEAMEERGEPGESAIFTGACVSQQTEESEAISTTMLLWLKEQNEVVLLPLFPF